MVKVVKILNLIFMGFFLSLSRLLVLPDDLFNLFLEVGDVLVVLSACRLQVRDVLSHLVFALLRHQGLTHTVGNRTLVQGLVGRDSHLDFVADAHQQESSLSTVDNDLTNKFIEALREELFTVWADAGLTSLASLNGSIKMVLKVDNVNLCGGLGRNVTDPEIARLMVLTRRQDRVQVVLITLLLVLTSLLHGISWSLFLAPSLSIGDRCGDKDGVVVSDERVGRCLGHICMCCKFQILNYNKQTNF